MRRYHGPQYRNWEEFERMHHQPRQINRQDERPEQQWRQERQQQPGRLHNYEAENGNGYRHRHGYDDMHRRPDAWDRRHEDLQPQYPFGTYQPREEDYNTLYETTNYYGIPRPEDYGRPHAHRDYGHDHLRDSRFRSDMEGRGGYWDMKDNDFDLSNDYNEASYSRNPDNSGNFGYRHDPAYGSSEDLWGD